MMANSCTINAAPYPSRMPISGPRSNQNHEDRFLQCEEDLEADFQKLVWKALQAGWDEGEACVAIASLADHHILAMECNEKTKAAIQTLNNGNS